MLIINYILEEKSILHLSCSMTNMVIIEKTSLQSKFWDYDAKNELNYAFPLSHDHNHSLIVTKQRCDPSKVDDCYVMSLENPLHSKHFGITTPKLHYAVKFLYHTTIINHYWWWNNVAIYRKLMIVVLSITTNIWSLWNLWLCEISKNMIKIHIVNIRMTYAQKN